jgi:hypothetical protein
MVVGSRGFAEVVSFPAATRRRVCHTTATPPASKGCVKWRFIAGVTEVTEPDIPAR